MSIPQSLLEADQAVALSYQPSGPESAPTLCAAGDNELAQAIIQLALANDIPIYENAELTHWLAQLELGEEIPAALYEIVAAILTMVYRIQNDGRNQ
jgi:flagellar biosynthesis protein